MLKNKNEAMQTLNKLDAELKNVSFPKACENLNIQKKKAYSILQSLGYKYIRETNSIEPFSATLTTKSSSSIVAKSYNDTMLNNMQKNKLMDLLNRYDDIINILENNCKNKNIIIDLPNSETQTTSIGVNKKVWDSFKKFSNKHKQFTSKDLISLALKELMNKYK